MIGNRKKKKNKKGKGLEALLPEQVPPPPPPKALALWNTVAPQSGDRTLILQKMVPMQVQIFHIFHGYINVAQLKGQGQLKPCFCCGDDFAARAEEQPLASLAFTSGGNEFICIRCSTDAVERGTGHTQFVQPEKQESNG